MGTNDRKRRWPLAAALLLALAVPGYYALVLHSPASGAPFALDLAQLRALAESVPGAKPAEIRYEQVVTLTFSEAMIVAGASWRKSPMPIYSYQLVYPDRTLIVDTAMARGTAQPEFLVAAYDDAAYARMNAALEKAAQIVTHEHMDHIGGVAAHPKLAQLLPALRLTREQLDNPKGMAPASLPEEAMRGYAPLRYDGLLPIAPGVVLVKAPGHTPGSQMVYVRRADGRELLFLGDVSWRLRNVELERERPLFMTLLIGEDRQAVLGQFAALHGLMRGAPAVRLVPGHDGPVVESLEAEGLLEKGFM